MAIPTDGLNCLELVELVTEYLEDALDGRDRSRFDAHVARCLGCRGHLRAVRSTISVLGALGRRTLV